MARKTSSQQPASFVRAIRSSSTKHIQAMAFFCFLWGFNTCMQRQQRRLRFAHKMPIEHIATTLALDFSRLLLEDYYGSSSLQNDEASTLRKHIFRVHVRERANDLSRTVPFLATLPNIHILYEPLNGFLFFLGLLFFGFMCPALWLFGWHGMTWLGLAWHRWKALTHICSRAQKIHTACHHIQNGYKCGFQKRISFVLSHWRAHTQMPGSRRIPAHTRAHKFRSAFFLWNKIRWYISAHYFFVLVRTFLILSFFSFVFMRTRVIVIIVHVYVVPLYVRYNTRHAIDVLDTWK